MTSTAIVASPGTQLVATDAQLEEEIVGYHQFAEALRSVRKCVARNQLPEAQEQCARVVSIAQGLQGMAQTRGGSGARHARHDREAPPAQYLWLRDAQARARRELAVTLTVLSDLHEHTAAVLSALNGQGALTYDERGRRR